MSITIRNAQPADADLIAQFNIQLADESESKRLDESTVRRGVRRLLGDASLGRYFLAEVDGRVVGQMMITFEWSDWRDGLFWWIQSVYVVADARQRGVFRALFDHVQRLSREADDVCGLRLYVEEENDVAHQAYERLGLKATGYSVREWERSADADS